MKSLIHTRPALRSYVIIDIVPDKIMATFHHMLRDHDCDFVYDTEYNQMFVYLPWDAELIKAEENKETYASCAGAFDFERGPEGRILIINDKRPSEYIGYEHHEMFQLLPSNHVIIHDRTTQGGRESILDLYLLQRYGCAWRPRSCEGNFLFEIIIPDHYTCTDSLEIHGDPDANGAQVITRYQTYTTDHGEMRYKAQMTLTPEAPYRTFEGTLEHAYRPGNVIFAVPAEDDDSDI